MATTHSNPIRLLRTSLVSLVAVALVASAAFASGVERTRPARSGSAVPNANWVVKAAPEGLTAQPEVQSARSLKAPVAMIWTDSYVYTANFPASVSITLQPNGWSAPVTMYLYRQNRATGAKEYYNLPQRSFLPVGESADLFGTNGPIAVYVPTLSDFELFGAGGALGDAVAASATGRYQMVIELRDASGSRVISKSNSMYSYVSEIVQVTSNLTSNATWTNDKAYVLATKAIFVNDGATLTIEPGTFVFGTKAQQSALVVARGGKIIADGTEMNPIVMTSDQPVGQRGRADWGGLILNGRAPINVGEAEGEGDTGTFGGNDPDDNSGVLRYVRVEFAGIEFSPENELNGIAFQGVGRGTVVDHVQVHFNKDDGVEFFGGTVNARYMLLTSNADDSMDWVLGWQGSVQFVVIQQSGDDADNGFEGDNLAGNNDNTPRSNPTIYNVTLIGDPDTNEGGESDLGMLLREGTDATIRNVIVMGFKDEAVEIPDESTHGRVTMGGLSVENMIYWNNDDFGDAFTKDYIENEATNRNVNPMLVDPYMLLRPDMEPREGSPALDIRYVATPADDGFLVPTDFIGGVAPGNNWPLSGWATFVRN